MAWVCEHLGSDAEAWERVVFTFNQKHQLPALAPHVPTARPRLGRHAYAMVAASFVPHRQKRLGGDLLPLLKGWPHAVLSDVADEVSHIITRHLQACPAGSMTDMQRALAELHSVQVRLSAAARVLRNRALTAATVVSATRARCTCASHSHLPRCGSVLGAS